MLKKKYCAEKVEKKMQDLWKENNLYEFDINAKGELYSIDTPPPTVSGKLHIGHIFSYTQAEIIARYKRMQGMNVFYPFGFDDNGLPTERLVEREHNLKARDMDRSEFIQLCLNTTSKYEGIFKDLWNSMGFSCDWNLGYSTINPLSQRISQKSFIELVKDGKAYMDNSPVLWCTECQTSIAQAELESIEKPSTFNYLSFKVEDDDIIIATTRPELLYGCVAIFIHPDDERYNQHIGKQGTVPLYDFDVPILGDERVDIDKGTGIVMCCTFGDTTDIEWYKEYKFQYKEIILKDGKIHRSIPYINDLYVNQARKKIIKLLTENGVLIKTEDIIHSVQSHERCGRPIEIIPSNQWYIDILNHKDEFIKAADKINWYPKYMKARYLAWVENLKWDWCISRQRFFGVPFPIWYCKDCGSYILASEDNLPVNPLEDSPPNICHCGCDKYVSETAVLDTWATSSTTPLINSKWKEDNQIFDEIMPMSMRTQAHEIIRTWAFYSIVKSIYHTGDIPWKDIMICGFVLAKKGEKFSKSKKNSKFDPSELIKEYSADSIRYWSATAKLGSDTMFDVDELKHSKRFKNKLYNAAKFSLMHLKNYEKIDVDINDILPIDQWIIESYKQTIKLSKEFLDIYELGLGRQVVDDFFWKDFCDNYLEIVKDRLYKPEKYGMKSHRSAQYALYTVFLGILKLYAIYTPHITDYIYTSYFVKHEDIISLHKLTWDDYESIDNNILDYGDIIKSILTEARRYKSERNMSLNETLNKIYVKSPSHLKNLLKTLPDLIFCSGAIELEITKGNALEINIDN